MKYVLSVILTAALLCFGVYAEQTLKLEEFAGSGRQIEVSAEGNELVLNVQGRAAGQDSPAIFLKAFELDAAECNVIRIVMKTDLKLDNDGKAETKIYFRTADLNYAESRTAKAPLTVNSGDEYVEYVYDFSNHSEWSDTVTGCFFSFEGDVKGKAWVKSVTLDKNGESVAVTRPKLTLEKEDKITDKPTPVLVKPISKFSKSRKYGETFTDVTTTDWFHDSVESAYDFGFVNGDSDTTYNPEGSMTVAEGITIAARMHAIVKGEEPMPKGVAGGDTEWYFTYVLYAKQEGFLGSLADYEAPIKRHEMVTLFASALPEETFTELNYITSIPDVPSDAPYAKDIYTFYRAGICMGNDIYGTFNPESNITRAEVSAIIDRIADFDHRLDKDLAEHVDGVSAYYIIDDTDWSARNTISTTLQSGWDYDIRGGMPKDDDVPPYTLADINNKEPVTLTRSVTVQDAGVVTTASAVTFNSSVDGWYMEVCSSDGLSVWKLYTNGGEFCVVDNGAEKKLGITPTLGKESGIRVTADLAAHTVSYIIGNHDCGTFAFASPAANNIAVLRTGTTAEAVMDTKVSLVKMYCNYLANDAFNSCDKPMPCEYAYSADGDVTAAVESGELVFNGNEGKATVRKSFKAASGEIALDMIFLYKEMADGMTVSLNSGDNAVLTFTAKDGKLYANGTELRAYSENMWYMLRLVADTGTKKCCVKVSGKTVKTDIPFASDAASIDNYTISSENNGGKSLRIDDVKVQKLVMADDYPAEPKVPAGADDYYIGMNWCSLWRNGSHWGWDNISPYDENKPYLGFYDEGLPEVADWEIKFMAEHGVDFELICWYHSGETPMKTFYGSTPESLFNGFMNSKYADQYGRFALLWEAGNGQKPTSFEDFRDRFLAFWMEYFFTDPRYMVIDNKLVMSIFSPQSLIAPLGSTAEVKKCFDYMREQVKTLGYDDIIIMACSGSSSTSEFQTLHDMGIDAVHAYNWGNAGSSAAVNQNNIFAQQKNGVGLMHNVPTVSTGFNNIAWAYTRHDNLTTENMEQVLIWIRDKALKNYEVTGKDDAWKQKFIMLSTWNEYGEGTYMMPSGLNGFGYLDTVRKVFTKGGAHEDDRPTTRQMARLDHLYPINREIIRADGYYQPSAATELIGKIETTNAGGELNWTFGNSRGEIDSEGYITGTATNADPLMSCKMPLGDLNAADIKQVRVYVEGPVGNSVQLFFQTKNEQTWTEGKSAKASITKEGLNPIILDLSKVASWSGTVTALRLDPISSQDSFKFGALELLGEGEVSKVLFNGKEIAFNISPVMVDDDMLVPFFPDSGIGYILGCAYTWDKVNQKLTLVKNDVTLVYSMNSEKCTVNGVPTEMGCKVYKEDGVPMIPIVFTAKTLKIKVEDTGDSFAHVYEITTIPEAVVDEVNKRVENQWEFNVTGDNESWTLGNATASVMNGAFYGNDMDLNTGLSNHFDPALTSPVLNFSANSYSKLVIGMKHEIKTPKTDANKGEFDFKIYFKSSAGGLAESRTFKTPLEQSSNGEFVEYTFDLNHAEWTGTISGIRVDPFNNVEGEFWIDYIRFIK